MFRKTVTTGQSGLGKQRCRDWFACDNTVVVVVTNI